MTPQEPRTPDCLFVDGWCAVHEHGAVTGPFGTPLDVERTRAVLREMEHEIRHPGDGIAESCVECLRAANGLVADLAIEAEAAAHTRSPCQHREALTELRDAARVWIHGGSTPDLRAALFKADAATEAMLCEECRPDIDVERLAQADHDVIAAERGCGDHNESFDDHMAFHVARAERIVARLTSSEKVR